MEVGCWAHARRKFHEARTSDPERAHAAIAWIGQLYGVERQARDEGWDDAKRMAARTERSRPLLESFSAWLEGEAKKVLPRSPVGEAIAYAQLVEPEQRFSRYLELPYLSIDNNASENAIRPIALGRKNWLHLGSDRGGRTAATLLSLVQSCKNLGNEPFAYLRDVLERVNTHPHSRLDDLLPDRRVLPVKGPPRWPKRIDMGQAFGGCEDSGKHGGLTASIRQGFLAREGRPHARHWTLRSRLNPRPADPRPSKRSRCRLISKIVAGSSRGAGIKDVGSGSKDRLGRESLLKAASSRGRCRRGLAARPLGSECGRPDDDAPGADRHGRRPPCPPSRGGADWPTPTGAPLGRLARGVRGVRAGDLTRAVQGGYRAGQAGGADPHGRPRTALLKAAEIHRLKAERAEPPRRSLRPPWHRPDLSAEDLGCGLRTEPTGSDENGSRRSCP